MIDWSSEDSCYLLSNKNLKNKIVEKFGDLKSHIWLQTSGTTSTQYKLVALAKKSILVSAAAVNKHLESVVSDVWFCTLPYNHIGGLSIFARAHLSGAQVVLNKNKWRANDFIEQLKKERISLCSLVPTQLYDLVTDQLQAPDGLRAVLIGGGALNESLYQSARELGWPVLPTYGMTECSSQIATASLSSLNEKFFPQLRVLPHMSVRLNKDQTLEVKSQALLSGYVNIVNGELNFCDPKVDGWYETNDLIKLEKDSLIFMGRKNNLYKISGNLVNLEQLREAWTKFYKSEKAVLIATPNLRTEFQIDLISDDKDILGLKEKALIFNERQESCQKIRNIYLVEKLCKTSLFKIHQGNNLSQIGF